MNNFYETLKKFGKSSPASAAVARGMVEYFNSDAEDFNRLRICQQQGILFAEEVGITFVTQKADKTPGQSTSSKVARLMRDAGVFQQFEGRPKRGVGHILVAGENMDDFMNFLEENEDYGTHSGRKGDKISDVRIRHRVITHFDETGYIRINGDTHPLPSREYNFVRQMLNDGRLDAIFVKPGTKVKLLHNDEGVVAKYTKLSETDE